MSAAQALPPDLLLDVAAAHDAAFREVTGKWREYRGLVRTPGGGTFFPSEVGALAGALPQLGLRGRILEIGSGDGRVLTLLAYLRSAGLVAIEGAVGVELVPEYLEAARRARARLDPPPDMAGIEERCADARAVDLRPFDVLLYFAGGAMPEPVEEEFREKVARELRAAARLVAWGPGAGAFRLPRLCGVAIPGYHTVHVFGGRRSRGAAGRPRG